MNIPACDNQGHSMLLKSAKEVLDRNGKQLVIFELESEPFLKQDLTGLFGVVVREEERR